MVRLTRTSLQFYAVLTGKGRLAIPAALVGSANPAAFVGSFIYGGETSLTITLFDLSQSDVGRASESTIPPPAGEGSCAELAGPTPLLRSLIVDATPEASVSTPFCRQAAVVP